MQPASNLREMSFSEELVGQLAYRGIKLRPGQEDFIRYVDLNPLQPVFNGVLPTGYGKSKTAECACHILKRQGRANRFLFIVPTDTQRTQYIEGIGSDVLSMGLDLKLLKHETDEGVEYSVPMIIDHTSRVLRAHRNNLCEVYVTTVQSITANQGFYLDLMSSGRWCVFGDEYQKLNKEDGAKWGKAVDDLPCSVMLGLTATPVRTDKKQTVFSNKDPDVIVTFEEAYQQEAIRGVVAHIEHYFVDIETDGGVERVTTENIDNYDLSKELRFTSKYQASIFASAYSCLAQKNLKHHAQHQMLVFAMTVSHAKSISETLNAMFGAGFSNWVGVGDNGRPDKENKDILKKYKENRLPCLVQVDIAGEGFDNPRSSVLVFLHLLRKATVKAIQQAGRGVRRNYGIRLFKDDVCDIFASPDTEMSELAVELARRTLDSTNVGAEKSSGTSGVDGIDGSGRLPPIYGIPPFDSQIADLEFDRSEVVSKISQAEIDGFRSRVEKEEGDASRFITDDRLRQILADHLMEQVKRANAIGGQHDCAEIKVAEAEKILAGNALRQRFGHSIPKTAWGDAYKAIRRAWKKHANMGHSDMLEDDFRRKHAWLVSINENLSQTREVPVWLQL